MVNKDSHAVLYVIIYICGVSRYLRDHWVSECGHHGQRQPYIPL